MSDVYASSKTFPAQGASGKESGTLSYLDAGGEQTVVEYSPGKRVTVHGIWLDLVNMTQDGTIKVYHKVDGSNYRLFKSVSFTVATDPDGQLVEINASIDSDLKVTYTEGADEGAARDLPYALIHETKE